MPGFPTSYLDRLSHPGTPNTELLDVLLVMLPRGAHWNQKEKTIPLAVSFRYPLQTKLNIEVSGKGKLFKGSILIFTEQAMEGRFGAEKQ